MGRKKINDDTLKKVSKTVSMTKYEWLHLERIAEPDSVSKFLIKKHKLKNEPLPDNNKPE